MQWDIRYVNDITHDSCVIANRVCRDHMTLRHHTLITNHLINIKKARAKERELITDYHLSSSLLIYIRSMMVRKFNAQ